MKKVSNKQEHTSKQTGRILRRNQKEILVIKNTVTEKKNAFNGLISRPEMAEERIRRLEDRS